MATPAGDSYAVASGGVIAAGRHYVQPACALVGDSLTDPSYALSTFYWLNGLNGGKLQLLANSGVSGNTVQGMLDRINNDYLNVSPGVAGLSQLGRIFIRAGTNDARNNTAIGSLGSVYTSLFTALLTYAQRIVILAVPPLAGAYAAQNPRTIEYNAWLATYAAANPAQFKFIDDCANVRDGAGAQLASFFSDGTHMNNAGVYQMGLDGAQGLSADLANYPSPLSKDPADIYPAQPQWVSNPTNAGAGGSKGANVTGTVVNSVSVSIGGIGSAVCSIVAADGGDPNQTPWQRVQMATGSAGGSVTASFSTAGRTITSTDPALLEAMVEVRFNSVDMSKLDTMNLYLQANTGEYLVPKIPLRMGAVSGQSKTVTLRQKIKRSGATVPASVQALLALSFASAFASSIGSFDFRCCTIRG